MIKIAIAAREYPVNNSDNTFGDNCALVSLAVRTRHPAYEEEIVEARHWLLISSVGKPPIILTEEQALQARANTFFGKEGLCAVVENSHHEN